MLARHKRAANLWGSVTSELQSQPQKGLANESHLERKLSANLNQPSSRSTLTSTVSVCAGAPR